MTPRLSNILGKSQYSFSVPEDTVTKQVHWYLMRANSYYSRPQREEFFQDSGYYKYHEAYHLLKFANEKQIFGEGVSGVSGSEEERPLGAAGNIFNMV